MGSHTQGHLYCFLHGHVCGIPAGSQGIPQDPTPNAASVWLLQVDWCGHWIEDLFSGSCGIPVGSHGIPHPGASILLPAWACVWDPSWIPQDPTRSHFLRFCMAPSSRVVSSIRRGMRIRYLCGIRILRTDTYTSLCHLSIWRVYPQTSAVCRYLVIWCMRIRILWDLLSTYPSADTDCIHASDGRLSAAGTGLTDSR